LRRTGDLKLEAATQRRLLQLARWALRHTAEVEGLPPIPGAEDLSAPVILTVFDRDGGILARIRVEGQSERLDETVLNAVEAVRPKVAACDPAGVFLHLQVVSRTASFPNLGIAGLFDGKVYEPRVTGLVYELGAEKSEIDPIQALALDLDSKRSRQYLARTVGIDPRDMPNRPDLSIEIYRVIHFGERYPDHAFTRFFRGHAWMAPDDVTTDTIRRSLRLIGDWYGQNVINSEVTYQYDPTSCQFNEAKRTIVRSTMAAWILNRLAVFLDDDHLRSLGEETIAFYLERYFQMKKSLAAGRLQPSPEPLANGYLVANHYTSAAFMVAAILERGELEKYREEVRLLMDWCTSFQRPDGTLWTEWAQNQFFMPGQLMLVASYLYRETGAERLRTFFDRTFDAYEGPLHGVMDFGPGNHTPYAPGWVTQPIADMYLQTRDGRYLPMIWRINDRIVAWYEDNARHQVYPDYDGILAPKPGFYGNNSITAAALESLVDAAQVAQETGEHERLEAYRRVIRRSAAYLLRMQYSPENTYYVRDRRQVIGGFKKDLVNNLVWCDNGWHVASAFMKICALRPAFEG
jgi:hypothetical protein